MKAATLPDQGPIIWRPPSPSQGAEWPLPSLGTAMARGLAMRCPSCGQTRLFAGYLTVTPTCANCGAPLGLARADDAPPYFTIVAVAHIIVPGMLFVEKAYRPALYVHAAIWLPLSVILALLFLRPIKGATVGLMLKLGMLKSGLDE